MIHPHDEQSLQRMLGMSNIPGHVRDEAELWTQMYHRDGNSGPLGSKVLIPLVRSLGYAPPQLTKPTKAVWQDLPAGSRVEAYFMGLWQAGVFQGLGPGGVLAVKLDTDPNVRECRPDMVRLAGSSETLAKATSLAVVPPAGAPEAEMEIDGRSPEALELAQEAAV